MIRACNVNSLIEICKCISYLKQREISLKASTAVTDPSFEFNRIVIKQNSKLQALRL